jgi:putative ABC transport system substrate-binding protein
MTTDARGRSLSRRQFVQGAGVAGLGLLAGCGRLPGPAPTPVVHRIGYLDLRGSDDPERAMLWEALGELGYREGQNLLVESRLADGDLERLASFATELAAQNLELIVAAGTIPAGLASKATSQTPIVMMRGDAVGLGPEVIASFSRPGGNLTGVVTAAADYAGKWLELLNEVLPELARVALLFDPMNDSSPAQLQVLEHAAEVLHIGLQHLTVAEPDKLAAAFSVMKEEHAGALILVPGGRATLQRAQIAALALMNQIPAMSEWPDFAASSGLMGYGASRADLIHRAATFVDRVLKGEKPADLPVERPMRFDFVINLKTAQALGLTIPQHVLLQATDVIQ